MKNKFNILFFVITVPIAGFLIFKNWGTENFWDASFIQIATLFVAATLSFFFVQKLTDKRRKVDCFDHVLTEIQNKIDNDIIIFSLNKNALTLQKSIANKIKHLKEHSFPKIKEDLEYIENQFEELRSLYGNHRTSDADLKSVEPDMIRHKTNISDKIDKIKLELYDM